MEETIDLREFVAILAKGKRLIATVTAVAVIAAAFVSYLVMKPVYLTNATVSVDNGLAEAKELSDTDRYVKEVITPAIYTERIRNVEVIEAAIKKSGVKSYSVGAVQSQLTITPIPDTNLLQLTLKGANAAEAQKMLDSLIEVTKESLLKKMLDNMEADKEAYATQLKTDKENLEDLLKQYQQQASELDLPSVVLINNISPSENLNILDGAGSKALSNLSAKELSILNELSNKIKAMETVYQEHLTKERELASFMNVFNIDNKVMTVSAPIEQASPVSPRPVLNMAIAFVIGLIASAGFVFLRYCWQAPK